ncbi:hypothetical protein [Sedimentitalea todarodis]|uniref:Uncharacterized protein n=1 Tax=Sedimentitalea todarodis TaxID=1631240 RepID=A0ABU3VCZ1_9RHOB|nr:hypothetical protein [Sedimentitalea todarodis]MDU9004041.1 hypothetical protein [Sedimentitalea todarodis]
MKQPDNGSPYANLCAAISILQTHIMATDSVSDPVATFGSNYMPTPSLELCENMLTELLKDVELLEDHRKVKS